MRHQVFCPEMYFCVYLFIYFITFATSNVVEEITEQNTFDSDKQRNDLLQAREQPKVDRVTFNEEKKQIQKSVESTDVLHLNVGGELIMTTRATLTRVAKSTLATMFNGRWEHDLSKDRDGHIFLDFNPILFRHLLEQLRVLESDQSMIIYPALSTPVLVMSFEKMLRKLGFDLSPKSNEDVIAFNVGGEQLTTQRKTLYRMPDIISSNTDANNSLFLDYNPKLFRHRLDQMREEQTTNTSYLDEVMKDENSTSDVTLSDFNLNLPTTAVIDEQTRSPLSIYNDGICANATWNRNGVTVAGGNGQGSALNQLDHPMGVFVDDDTNVYVADTHNHRVIQWASGASTGQVVAGGIRTGNDSDFLNYLASVVVDKNGTIFICDTFNNRISKWFKNDHHRETVIANISCWGLAIDNEGALYVSGHEDQRVTKWPNEQIVAGGNGGGSNLNQLSNPYQLFLDRNQSVYIADYFNHRVMQWPVNSKEGIIVAGGNGYGDSLDQLKLPHSVVVDHMGTIYVVDFGNDRIMRWFKNSTSGHVIVGGQGSGNGTTQLSDPYDLAFDRQGNLYVADTSNHRVQMFTIDKSSCITDSSTAQDEFIDP